MVLLLCCDRPNPTKTCFAIADWWLYGPVCMFFAGISSKLFLELSRVQDRINMSKEISSAAIAWLVTSSECLTLKAAVCMRASRVVFGLYERWFRTVYECVPCSLLRAKIIQ